MGDNIKLILRKYNELIWTGFIWLRIGTSGWALANTVMNIRGSIKCCEVLEQLHNWRLLKKDSAP
jgi:hypothetical protein